MDQGGRKKRDNSVRQITTLPKVINASINYAQWHIIDYGKDH